MSLNKRIFRDLSKNRIKYASIFIVVVIAMYVVVSMAGASATVIQGVNNHAEENFVEDGQFTLFVKLTESEENELKDLGVSIEEHFYNDFNVNNTTLRVFQNRKSIDLIDIDVGRLPVNDDEIVLEKQYFKAHNMEIGDHILIADNNYEVVGYGSSPDYDDMLESLTDASSKSENFGTAFVTRNTYRSLQESGNSLATQSISYAYRLNDALSENEFRERLSQLKFKVDDVEDETAREYFNRAQNTKNSLTDSIANLSYASNSVSSAASNLARSLSSSSVSNSIANIAEEISSSAGELGNKSLDIQNSFNEFSDEYLDFSYSNLKEFTRADENPRINASADDIRIDGVGALIAGVIILILLAYILSIFTTNIIDGDSKIIGTLYSMGYRRRELILHYILLPVCLCFFGGILGTCLGFVGMASQISENSSHFSYPVLSNVYPAYLLFYGIGTPFLLSLIINLIVLNRRLSRQPLALMRKQQTDSARWSIDLPNFKFISKFRIKLYLRELKAQMVIAFGIFVTLLLVMLAMTIYSATTTIIKETSEDIGFKYMYYMSFPEDESPNNVEEAYMLKLNKSYLNHNFEVSVLGIHTSSTAFPYNIEAKSNEVYISTSVANKYKVAVGDTLSLKDEANNLSYDFEVKEIVKYAPGLFVFMNIDEMRNRFNVSDDFYNVLLSQEELDIDRSRVYSVTTDTSIKDSSEIFWSLMKGLVYVLVLSSILMFVLVMYLMVKMIIDRQTSNISMFKVFGYTSNELSKLFLRNNLYTVILSAIIFIPLTKWIIELIYPFLTSNRSVGFNLSFRPETYLFLFLLIIVSYVMSYFLVKRNLNKVSIQEILNERE